MPSRLQAARGTDRDTSTERGLAFLSKPGAMPTGNEAQCLTDQNLHDGARCIEFGEVDVRRCYSGLNKRFVSCLRSRYERDHVVRNFADLMRSFVEKASSPYSDVRSFRSARYVLLCENETHRAIAARRHLIEPERVNNGACARISSSVIGLRNCAIGLSEAWCRFLIATLASCFLEDWNSWI